MAEVSISTNFTIFLYGVANPEQTHPTKSVLHFLRTKCERWPHQNLSSEDIYSLSF